MAGKSGVTPPPSLLTEIVSASGLSECVLDCAPCTPAYRPAFLLSVPRAPYRTLDHRGRCFQLSKNAGMPRQSCRITIPQNDRITIAAIGHLRQNPRVEIQPGLGLQIATLGTRGCGHVVVAILTQCGDSSGMWASIVEPVCI